MQEEECELKPFMNLDDLELLGELNKLSKAEIIERYMFKQREALGWMIKSFITGGTIIVVLVIIALVYVFGKILI